MNLSTSLGPEVITMFTSLRNLFCKSFFLDALASLGSMLESHSVSQSVGNVFEILSNIGHIIRVCTEYVQSMFRYVQSVFRLRSECAQSVFRVHPECVQSFFHFIIYI